MPIYIFAIHVRPILGKHMSAFGLRDVSWFQGGGGGGPYLEGGGGGGGGSYLKGVGCSSENLN